jgi:hypothetical protein
VSTRFQASIRRVSKSLKTPHTEDGERLEALNSGETGHNGKDKRFRARVGGAASFVVFRIGKTRSTGILSKIPGPSATGDHCSVRRPVSPRTGRSPVLSRPSRPGSAIRPVRTHNTPLLDMPCR